VPDWVAKARGARLTQFTYREGFMLAVADAFALTLDFLPRVGVTPDIALLLQDKLAQAFVVADNINALLLVRYRYGAPSTVSVTQIEANDAGTTTWRASVPYDTDIAVGSIEISASRLYIKDTTVRALADYARLRPTFQPAIVRTLPAVLRAEFAMLGHSTTLNDEIRAQGVVARQFADLYTLLAAADQHTRRRTSAVELHDALGEALTRNIRGEQSNILLDDNSERYIGSDWRARMIDRLAQYTRNRVELEIDKLKLRDEPELAALLMPFYEMYGAEYVRRRSDEEGLPEPSSPRLEFPIEY
jgi:hypothetical protein